MKTDIDPMDLVLLMEEAAEVIQAASKCLRFGPHNSWVGYDDGETKLQALMTELGQLQAIMDRLGITELDTCHARVRKHEKLKEWGPEKRGRGMLG